MAKSSRGTGDYYPKTARSRKNTLLSYNVGNTQGIGTREYQEDSFAIINALSVNDIIKQGMFAAVADGMGGLEAGKQVSEMAVASVCEQFREMDRNSDMAMQLERMFHTANRNVFETFGGDGGTTLVVCIIYDAHLYWASVGDSSIFLKRGGGLYKLNKEHIYLNRLYAGELLSADIDRRVAESHPDKARLYEFIGKDFLDELDCSVKPLSLREKDVIILCTDGVTSALSENEIYEIIRMDTQMAGQELNNRIIGKGLMFQDNYTAVIIKCF